MPYVEAMNSPYTSSKLRSAPPPLIPDDSNGDSPPSKQARECSPKVNIETVMNATILVNYSPLKIDLDNSFANISVLSTIEEEDHESSPEPATTSRIDEKTFFLMEWTQLKQLLQLARCPTCIKRLMDECSSPNVHRKGSAIVVRCSCEIWKCSSQSQVQGVAICSGDFALSVGCYTAVIPYSRRFTVALTFTSTLKKPRSLNERERS
ncbi:hypothetical protein L596_029033 [Steinernema carpocapsae]|uniref:Uncharacterized protein n=1 Tax=Steinernema carpocapsae TaxID=34508 RepID=A0A4U5LTF2_STECR|nr:hypothetical protein L596_029033 [Steinernema carpocapsae]